MVQRIKRDKVQKIKFYRYFSLIYQESDGLFERRAAKELAGQNMSPEEQMQAMEEMFDL